jgi:serralysin
MLVASTMMWFRLGGAGNDTMRGDAGRGTDVMDGGTGTDTATEFQEIYDGPINQLTTDTLISIETVIGTGFNDDIRGNSSANVLDGRIGNDILDGRSGNDTLIGGNGSDVLTGGLNADVFRFLSAGGSGGDF